MKSGRLLVAMVVVSTVAFGLIGKPSDDCLFSGSVDVCLLILAISFLKDW